MTASGYDVISAATGADAERLIATSAPDLVILDLGLPDKDGKEVIKTVRAFSEVPIIVLSARDREVEKIAALDLGANDYVESPLASANCWRACARRCVRKWREPAFPRALKATALWSTWSSGR